MKPIHLDTCDISRLEKKYINNALRISAVSKWGPYVHEFESAFQSFTKAKYVTSIINATSALFIILKTNAIGPGDEVIIPTLTFGATAHAVKQAGAKPILIDSDPLTWNMDVTKIEERITKKTRAIIPVHLYGNPCDMDTIMDIARRHDLLVIEDATESLGSYYKNKHTGTIGDYGVFSFNGNKLITTGQGGMIISNTNPLNFITISINQSHTDEMKYYYLNQGYNMCLPQLNAALGCAQMKRIHEFIDKKIQISNIYHQNLRLPTQSPTEHSTFLRWMNVTSFRIPVSIKSFNAFPIRTIFRPLHESYYNDKKHYPVSSSLYPRSICLPSSTLNTPKQIKYVCEVINGLL